jgi:nucleoside-diphosphate-sugar epimerase
VFGGEQKRPNIHIEDMTDLYVFLLEQPKEKLNRKIYNAGYENLKVRDIAERVNRTLGGNIPIVTESTNDLRSYHVCSRKIKTELGFEAKHTIEEAVVDLKNAFDEGRIPNPMEDIRYYNVKAMQALQMK